MKLLAKIIIIAAIFFLGFYTGQHYIVVPDLPTGQIKDEEDKEQIKDKISASLMLDFGNGKIETFNNVELKNDATVFTLLEKVTRENNIEFSYKDYGGELGVLVESISETANNFESGHYWQYWVNNSYAQIGASNCQLKEGDVVEWKYTKGQFDN